MQVLRCLQFFLKNIFVIWPQIYETNFQETFWEILSLITHNTIDQ